MTSDAELLRHYARQRSDDAFSEIVRRHVDFVYAAALRQTNGDAHLAGDVTQLVFTDLARKAARVAEHPVLAGWLHTSTRFAAQNLVRTERRRRMREEKAHVMNDLIRDEAAPIDWRRMQPVIDETLGELKPRERDAILLRYFEGRTFAEIGERLSVTETAARSCVDRALDKLRGLLARRGVTSTAAALGAVMANQPTVAAPQGLVATVAGGALAAASVTTGGLVARVVFMSTTKWAVGGIALVATLATAIAVREHLEVRRHELATASAQLSDPERGRMKALEERLAEAEKRARGAEDDNAKLLTAIEALRTSNDAAERAAKSTVISENDVQARYDRARQAIQQGDFAAALADLLWCYDDGMTRFARFAGVRGSFLLGDIGKLAEHYQPAATALRERLEQAKQRMAAKPNDRNAPKDFANLNHALGEDAATLAYYDQMPIDDPRRQGLASLGVYGLLVDAQRYRDAVTALPYDRMVHLFDASANPPGGELGERARTSLRESAVRMAARNVEALAGAGDLDHARELAAKALAVSNSSATIDTLQRHLAKAGHPEVLSEAVAAAAKTGTK